MAFCQSLNHTYTQVLDVENERRVMATIPFQIYCIVLGLFGTTGNVIVVNIYYRKSRKTSAMYFILSLAIMDLAVCFLLVPFTVIHESFYKYTFTSASICMIFEWVRHSSLSVSCITLGYIAIDRYFAICRPLAFILRPHRVKLMITFNVVIGAIFQLQTFFLFGVKTTKVSDSLMGCRCDVKDELYKEEFHATFVFTLLVLYIIMYLVIAVAYIKVYLTVRQRKKGHIQDVKRDSAGRGESHLCCRTKVCGRESMEDEAFDERRLEHVTRANNQDDKSEERKDDVIESQHREMRAKESQFLPIIPSCSQSEEVSEIKLDQFRFPAESLTEDVQRKLPAKDPEAYTEPGQQGTKVDQTSPVCRNAPSGYPKATSIKSQTSSDLRNKPVKIRKKSNIRRISVVSQPGLSRKMASITGRMSSNERKLSSKSLTNSRERKISVKSICWDDGDGDNFQTGGHSRSRHFSQSSREQDHEYPISLISRCDSTRTVDYGQLFYSRFLQKEDKEGSPNLPYREESAPGNGEGAIAEIVAAESIGMDHRTVKDAHPFSCCKCFHREKASPRPLTVTGPMNKAISSFQQARYNTARILLTVSIVFMLSWLPFWIIYLLDFFLDDLWVGLSDAKLNLLLICRHSYFINNMANPFIYAFLNKRFREDLQVQFAPLLRRLPTCTTK